MFRNLCHFPKFMFSENATCVKTERVAVIQSSFSDKTNGFFLSMTTTLYCLEGELFFHANPWKCKDSTFSSFSLY